MVAEAEAQIGNESSDTSVFPVVGIGASAGGLEAFEAFFRELPPDIGMAFVLISHLDPAHHSILTEILQRSTPMTVLEVQDQMKVEINHVYVIPPNRDMAIFHGVLQLFVPDQPRGMRMPIDVFLRSLAEDCGDRAVGIIFSGTGTDGTLGLRAILGAGGISLVQEPASAKYDGMPVSAINAGYATHVLPVEKMPEALLSGLRVLRQPPVVSVSGQGELNRILMLLRSATGHDFSLYKKSGIIRCIERRMLQHGIGDRGVYARYLKENPLEITLLFRELLINVTSFFRDPQAFDLLKREILPALFANKPPGYVFRCWVAGCATGEEAYSIGILLREYLDETHQEYKIQLYATDLDADAIATARAALYPPNIVQDVHPERLLRFFIREDGGYRIKKQIREMVVFATHNIVKDPPFARLDLLCCRNLLIYMESELQNRLISLFHYALKTGGVLFLSPSESTGGHNELYTAFSHKWKFYRAKETSTRHTLPDKSYSLPEQDDAAAKPVRESNFADLTRRVLLQTYAPSSVVTDEKGNILYVHGDTGKYLRPAPGHATLNIIDMAREGLQMPLRIALSDAAVPVLNREALIQFNGHEHAISFSVREISSQPSGMRTTGAPPVKLLLISFQDVLPAPPVKSGGPPKRAEKRRIEELERELAYSRDHLQATLEGEQASGEELKSINEELQSANEELQSTNEEFETSQEELRSVNEELSTLNAELHARIAQLVDIQNDMKNLLDNVNIGTLFLDDKLRIRRYTRDTVRLYCLVSTDVGRALSDIKTNIDNLDLLRDILAVQASLIPCERQVHTNSGSWYLARIRPYRTLDNVIDGVLVTFSEISEKAPASPVDALAGSIIAALPEPVLVLDAGLCVLFASRAYYRYFNTCEADTLGRPFDEQGSPWDGLRSLLENVLSKNQVVEGYRVEYEPTHRALLLNARCIDGKFLILLHISEVS